MPSAILLFASISQIKVCLTTWLPVSIPSICERQLTGPNYTRHCNQSNRHDCCWAWRWRNIGRTMRDFTPSKTTSIRRNDEPNFADGWYGWSDFDSTTKHKFQPNERWRLRINELAYNPLVLHQCLRPRSSPCGKSWVHLALNHMRRVGILRRVSLDQVRWQSPFEQHDDKRTAIIALYLA